MHLFNNDDGKTVNMELPKKDDVLASLRFRHLLLQQRLDKQIKKAEEEKEEAALKAKEEKEKAALKAKEEKDEAALELKKATNCNELFKTMLVNMNKLVGESKEELSLKKELVERIDAFEVELQDSRRRNEEKDDHIQAHIQTIENSRRRNEEKDVHIQAHIQTIEKFKALTNAADAQLAIKDTQLTISRAGEEAAEIRVQSTLQDGIEKDGQIQRIVDQNTQLTISEALSRAREVEAEIRVVGLESTVKTLQGEATTLKSRVECFGGLERELEDTKRELSSSKDLSTEQANRLQASKKDLEDTKRELSSSKVTSTEQANRLQELRTNLEETKAVSESQGKVMILNNSLLESQNQELSRCQTLHDKATKVVDEQKIEIGTLSTSLTLATNSYNELKAWIDEQKNEITTRTTLAYAIKSGKIYPLDTLAKMKNFVRIVCKRFKDTTSHPVDPSSFFPIEADTIPTNLLQALRKDQELINLIESDNVLVSTFYELIRMSFVGEEVVGVDYLDTILRFHAWVSEMIFKNRPNLLLAITKIKAVTGRKRKATDTGKINLTYTARRNEKEGSLITEPCFGTVGDAPQTRSILLHERIDNRRWHAYLLKKDGLGKLFCPFCELSFKTQGFTNHVKGCALHPKRKKK